MSAIRDWMFLIPAKKLQCEDNQLHDLIIHRNSVKNLSLLMKCSKNDGSESFSLKPSQLFDYQHDRFKCSNNSVCNHYPSFFFSQLSNYQKHHLLQ